jgi:hypothetical protein
MKVGYVGSFRMVPKGRLPGPRTRNAKKDTTVAKKEQTIKDIVLITAL